MYKRLERQGLLTMLERTGVSLHHIVLHHCFVPEGTAEDLVWKMLARMDERFHRFWSEVERTGLVTGAFVIRHFDPVVYSRARGILLHYHLAVQLRDGRRLPRRHLATWLRTARRGELRDQPFCARRGGPDAPAHEIKNVLMYVGRTQQIRGYRRASFLNGMRPSRFAGAIFRNPGKRRQMLRNGKTNADQLRLMLAAASYPKYDPGLLSGWDRRTRKGKEFFRGRTWDTGIGKIRRESDSAQRRGSR
ncbi:MAG: hypothetical protein IT436_14610 [Phycisphaerales bacterium]|nr:hypothetical protein [Phycisphaerales bacterium]